MTFADLARAAFRGAPGWLTGRPVRAVSVLAVLALILATVTFSTRSSGDATFAATVRRGTLEIRLTETGTLRPVESITYRSPLAGRETEVMFLAPEGTRVQEGDQVVRLDTTRLEEDLERVVQAQRQAEVQLQVAEAEREEALAGLESVTEGERALEVDEARANLSLAEKQLERLRREYAGLVPLIDKGYITRDELDRSALELEQAEVTIEMTRRKAELLTERTYPREQQRARLQLARREAEVQNARLRLTQASGQVRALRRALEACQIYARRPGLVVYEEYLAANPRRKVRVGDRVTASQGLVTIPEVNRMLVESSIREADVHRVGAGLPASVRVDAFPDLRLTGRVASVGTLARSSRGRSLDEKRFDLVVELDETTAELRPEMTARVEVLVGEREDVLLLPANAVFERDGVWVTHTLHGWGTETRPVEVGESNDFEVEIVAGLDAGDRVSLTDLGSETAGAGPLPVQPASRFAVP